MTQACRHHWIIETPNGPTSRGRCKRCRAERDFTNWSAKPTCILSAVEKAAVARARREEAAITSLIHEFGQGDYLPLSAYRRHLRDRDDAE